MELRDYDTNEVITPDGILPKNALATGQTIDVGGVLYIVDHIHWVPGNNPMAPQQYYTQSTYVRKSRKTIDKYLKGGI